VSNGGIVTRDDYRALALPLLLVVVPSAGVGFCVGLLARYVTFLLSGS
jgi:hypothetical protein